MAEINWEKLGPTKIGLVVEAEDDKRILEAFLTAGQHQGLWDRWDDRLIVEAVSGYKSVLRELERTNTPRIHGLIDRDWRSQAEIDEYTLAHSHLHVLPRIMIENYLIDPSEIINYIAPIRTDPVAQQQFQTAIEIHREEWVRHGVLERILREQGAYQFCDRHEGYPKALLRLPIIEASLREMLGRWIGKLNPNDLLSLYQQQHQKIHGQPLEEHYHRIIDGKRFFNEVIIAILNNQFDQQSRKDWLDDLLKEIETVACPPDLVSLFQSILPKS